MNLQDFKLAVGKLCLDPLCEPLTLFLQGGLSVTGTWEWLLNPDGERVPSAIIVEARDGTRTVVPIETITALREHREVRAEAPKAANCGCPIRRSLGPRPIHDEVG